MPPSRCLPPGRHSDNVVAILAQSRLAGRLLNSMSERLAVESAHLSPAHLLGCVAVPRSEPSDQAARLEEASCRARLARIRPLWPRLLLSARASRSRISARARHGSRRSLCQSSAMIGSSKRSSSPGSWPAAYGEWVSLGVLRPVTQQSCCRSSAMLINGHWLSPDRALGTTVAERDHGKARACRASKFYIDF